MQESSTASAQGVVSQQAPQVPPAPQRVVSPWYLPAQASRAGSLFFVWHTAAGGRVNMIMSIAASTLQTFHGCLSTDLSTSRCGSPMRFSVAAKPQAAAPLADDP